MRPGIGKFRSLGAWLSLLALYVQVSLPLLIAAELRVTAGPAVPAYAICGSGHGSTGVHDAGAPGTGDRHSGQCCPLCTAIDTPYLAPAEILVPAPAAWNSVPPHIAAAVAVASRTALTYNARAPPLNG